MCAPLTERDHWLEEDEEIEFGGEPRGLLCYFGSNDHVTSSGVTGGVGYWVWRPFKCVHLTHFKRLNWIFVHLFWIYNMKLCIFPQNARDFILDSSNITHNFEECAHARLRSSAPCLGLRYISSQNGRYSARPPAGDNSILYIVVQYYMNCVLY